MPPVNNQLCTRLEKLDIEILRQKKLLKKLKHNRIIARHRLSAALDPMAHFPLEVSSEIFFLCLSTSGTPFPQPGMLHLPALLLNICNSWRCITESMPFLWATIHIPSRDSAQGSEELVLLWLTCARNRLLSISLSGDASFAPKVVSTVWTHGGQAKHLEWGSELAMNLWEERAGPGPLPALETLVIRGLHMTRHCWFPSHQILKLLRLAPNLVECVFSDMEVEFAPVAPRTGRRLVLPNLRRLVFDESKVKRETPFSCGVLDHLALPALEALVVNVVGTELLSFLTESSPPPPRARGHRPR
ncbi:hypothetical protein B0H14DRAFT_3425660 [Mycena olivaceomarginata]|nr:hypothetical protein B0H14DRAFT_3425660 [Mycena olivaceomarginata]